MTKFWPVSVMLRSPALRSEQKIELTSYRTTGISQNTFNVCRHLASQMQGCDITMMYTEGSPLKRVYLKHPTPEAWRTLELEILIDTGYSFGMNVDTLH